MLGMEFMNTDYDILLEYPEPDEVAPEAQSPREKPENTAQPIRQDEPPPKPWKFEYYQQFFDVSTDEILSRIKFSAVPLPRTDFMTEVLQNKPDLYGPFWIYVTLAIELGLASQLAHYFQISSSRYSTMNTLYQASVLLFVYCWCWPTIMWTLLELYQISEVKYKLTEIFCLYGYASAVFAPAVALWVLPVRWVRWLAMSIASFISGLLICRSLRNAFCTLDRYGYYTLQLLLFALNAVVWASSLLMFFPTLHHKSVPIVEIATKLVNDSVSTKIALHTTAIDSSHF